MPGTTRSTARESLGAPRRLRSFRSPTSARDERTELRESSSGRRPHVLLVNWRDTTHPDGGGSERYVERMARGLVDRGYRVTVQCAAHRNAPRDSEVDGVRFRRRGGRLTVYLAALVAVLRLRPDLVVDVQNGLPFLSPLVARCPVIVLVHHVHREQWYSYLGRPLGGVGWWIESRLAPRLYRHCRYLTVSEVTAAELAALGIARQRQTVVHCGQDPLPATTVTKEKVPTLIAVSRLVPHKRIEHAVDAVARLRERWPDLRLDVVGSGIWSSELADYATKLGVSDRVRLHGWVDEETKHDLLAASWLHVCPSLKEGWGLVITEAGAHGVPSVGYRSAGGVAESIVDGKTGLLADGLEDFVGCVRRLLEDTRLRREFGEHAREHAERFTWEAGSERFADVVAGELSGGSAWRLPARRLDEPADQVAAGVNGEG